MLKQGDRAPDFALKDKDSNTVRLSDFKGKKVVLYFYPRDNTPGCTRQACTFAWVYDEFKNKNVEVNTIDRLCNILNCRVEDIMEHFPDDNKF